MASIQYKNGTPYLVYWALKPNGKKGPVWESIPKKETPESYLAKFEKKASKAKARKKTIVVNKITMGEMFEEFLPQRSKKKNWGPASFTDAEGILKNYIKPLIGGKEVRKFSDEDLDVFYDLVSRRVKRSWTNGEEVITPSILPARNEEKCITYERIIKIKNLMKIGLEYGLRKGYLDEIPIMSEELEIDAKPTTRETWDEEMIKQSMRHMEESPLLHLIVHLCFIGTLRAGETGAISLDRINHKSQTLRIDRSLQRALDSSLENVRGAKIVFRFPKKKKGSKSTLILKYTKTEDVREILLPDPVYEEILERIKEIGREKAACPDYHDYGLLFALPNGDPIEPKLISKWFSQWQMNNPGLPEIVLHALRHAGITYKMFVTGGDVKSVQNDSGHKVAKMVTDTYSHSLMINRIKMKEKIESQFYDSELSPQQVARTDVKLADIVALLESDPSFKSALFMALAGCS